MAEDHKTELRERVEYRLNESYCVEPGCEYHGKPAVQGHCFSQLDDKTDRYIRKLEEKAKRSLAYERERGLPIAAGLVATALHPYDAEEVIARALAARRLLPEHRACPCLHVTPCDPHCTCVNPYSSRGCARCCSYGSPEQQRTAAEWLSRSSPTPTDVEAALRAVPCGNCGRQFAKSIDHHGCVWFTPDYPAMARAVLALVEGKG